MMTSPCFHVGAPAREPFRSLPWQPDAVMPVCGGTLASGVSLSFTECGRVWQLIMEFMPWRAIVELRRVSRAMLSQSLSFVLVAPMPCTRRRAIFVACHADLDGPASVAADKVIFSKSDNRGAGEGTRMFFGQLRRSGTVRMVEWLVNHVLDAPRGSLVSVENHFNPTTGRGRGCAWPTIRDDATVNRLLLAHHRLFFDRVGGVEGVWLVPRGEEAVLSDEAGNSARGGRNHPRHMPRSAIVVEAPRNHPSNNAAAAAAAPAPTVSFTSPAPPPRRLSDASTPGKNLGCSVSSSGSFLGDVLSSSSSSEQASSSRSVSRVKVFHRDGSWRHNPYQL